MAIAVQVGSDEVVKVLTSLTKRSAECKRPVGRGAGNGAQRRRLVVGMLQNKWRNILNGKLPHKRACHLIGQSILQSADRELIVARLQRAIGNQVTRRQAAGIPGITEMI